MKEFQGTPLSRRERLIAREAVCAACKYLIGARLLATARHPWMGSMAVANTLFPPPMFTRNRIVPDPEGASFGIASDRRFLSFAAADGEIHLILDTDDDGYTADASMWKDIRPTAKRIALWADLLARPTEEVEGEE